VAADGIVTLEWVLPAGSFEAALFQALDPTLVHDGPPIQEGLSGTGTQLSGLTNGVDVYFGIGVRPTGGIDYTPSGVILRMRPGAPIYLDAAADPTGADGLTPGTAFPDALSAVLTAFSQVLSGGSGIVLVREGVYTAADLPVFAGVQVYGGFDASFDPATRDPSGADTVFEAIASGTMFAVQGGFPTAVFDGITIDGLDLGRIGIDLSSSSVEVRNSLIHRCTDHGVRMKNTSNDRFQITITNSSLSNNGGEGVSSDGPFDVRVDGSRFDSNFFEGFDFDDLIGPSFDVVTMEVTGSRFFGNGSEGADIDLNVPLGTPPGPGVPGGEFDVEFRGCRFEQNALDGLLIDEEYELFPDWRAEITVRECAMRANRLAGLHVDADGVDEVVVHRVLATGNEADGIEIASESQPGVVVVSASIASGNQGVGLRAWRGGSITPGNKTVLATHCIFAGNVQGGFRSEEVLGSAASSIAYLQPSPWTNVRLIGTLEELDPFAGTFQFAPEAFTRAIARNIDQLTVADPAVIDLGSVVELGDDAVLRTAVAISGNVVTVDPPPEAFTVPGTVSAFGPGASSTVEDWQLPVGSPAIGAGMSEPGAPAVDAGVWGAPLPGHPGFPDEGSATPFTPVAVDPPPFPGPTASQEVAIRFSADLDPASVVAGRVRAVTTSGTELAIGFLPLGDTIVVQPPPGGWGTQPLLLELNAGIASLAGVPLATPLAIPITP